MAEETVASTETTETTETVEQATKMVKEDGTLAENWRGMLTDESLRTDETLARFKAKTAEELIGNLSKSYVHVRKQVPLDKTAIPNENFTDADWDAWHKAGGRPETAADYNIVRPDDYPEELWDDNRAKDYQDFFHKIGLSNKQADALVAFNNEETLALNQSLNQQEELDFNTLKDALHKKWGAAYDQKVHLGNIAIEKGCIKAKDGKIDLDAKERLIEKINADPDLIELTSNLGSLFAEHKIVEDTQIPTPSDLDARISKETQHPAYMNAKHPDHERQVKLVQQLIQEKVKYSKTTG